MRKFTKNIFRSLLTLSVAGLGLTMTPSTAHAELYLNFTIDPSALGSDPNCVGPCVADRMDGSYVERFTVTSFDAMTGSGTFATDAYFDLLGFVKDEASAPLLGTGLNDDYGIYALFSATGTFAPNAQGGIDFIADNGSLDLYADFDLDSSPKAVPGSSPGPVTVSDPDADNDDQALANAILATGEGHTTSDPDSGDFEIVFDPFALTALGLDFFVAPVPFYTEITVRGLFDRFVPAAGFNDIIQGTANAQFLPEPATLVLFGLGLLGSGYAVRRRQAAQKI